MGIRMRRLIVSIAAVGFLAPVAWGSTGCGGRGEVRHSDYGYCERSVRHKHNDHVFLGDYHDHSLCEWSRFD